MSADSAEKASNDVQMELILESVLALKHESWSG
jgi:hypothetical protein